MSLQTYNLVMRDDLQIQIILDKEDLAHRDVLAHFSRGQYYEHETTMIALRVLQCGDTFIDVGANAGYFSLLAGEVVGAGGRVLAVEANPSSAALIRTSAALCEGSPVVVEEVAASDHCGRIVFETCQGNSNGGVVPGKSPSDPTAFIADTERTEYAADSTTLDALVVRHNIQRIKVIKIDTEGHELSVLRGASNILSQGLVDFIVCELNIPGLDRNGTDQHALRYFVSQYGYHTFLLDHFGDLPKFVPPGANILQQVTCNILFARIEAFGAYWPSVINTPAAVRIADPG